MTAPRRLTLSAVILFLLAPALLAQSARDQTLSLQIALEREGFSPGVLDAKTGRKTTIALTEFQQSRGLSPTGQPDPSTTSALALQNPTIPHTITPADLHELTGPNPKGWIAKSKVQKLGYETN